MKIKVPTRLEIKRELKQHDYSPEKQGVTVSLLNLWLSCEVASRMYLKGYYWGSSKGKSQVQGTIIHHGLDYFYRRFMAGEVSDVGQVLEECDRPNWLLKKFADDFQKEYQESDVETRVEYQLAYGVGAALVPMYFKHWNKDFDTDQKVWLEIERKAKFIHPATGIAIRGKRDGAFRTADHRYYLFESKSKDKFNENQFINHASRNIQNLTYLLGMQDEYHHTPSGILSNIVRRPSIRMRAKETLQGFVLRIRDDVKDRPDFYFIRKTLPVLPQRLEAQDRKLTIILNRFVKWWYSPEDQDMEDTERCFPYNKPCQYLKYCTSGRKSMEGLSIRPDTSDTYFNIGGEIEDL